MQTETIRIRPYAPADKPRLLEIWLAASLEAHSFLTRERLLAQQRIVGDIYLAKAETWVAVHSGEPAGFIGLLDGFIGGLFVDPQAQGGGIGRALVEHGLALKGQLTLEVYALNTAALAFYRRIGFQEIGRRPQDDEGLPFELIELRRSAEPGTPG